jgi:hypothetical protein
VLSLSNKLKTMKVKPITPERVSRSRNRDAVREPTNIKESVKLKLFLPV